MSITDVRVQVPPRAPKKKDICFQQMSFFFGFRRPKGGSTLRYFKCSAEVNSACAEVLPAANARTAQMRRRPEGRFDSSPAAASTIENIDFNRPLHGRSKLCIACSDFFIQGALMPLRFLSNCNFRTGLRFDLFGRRP